MPCTWPLKEPVAIHDNRRGTVTETLGVGSCAEKPPIWNREKPHGWHVFHCASEAAIFIPCALVTASPKRLPTDSWTSVEGTATISASIAARRKTATFRPRRKCQQQIPSMTIEPKISPARIVWNHAISAKWFESSAPRLVSCALPSTTL